MQKYGVRHRICKNCGDREVDVLDKVDHSWELVSTTPATCTIGEIQHYKCSVCGETKDVTLSNPLGEHSWDNGKVTKEATETEEGVKTYTCKTCGETKTEKIPVTSHHLDQGTITKKATCTENGEKTYHCTDADCDKTYVETIPATGHKFDSWKTVKPRVSTAELYRNVPVMPAVKRNKDCWRQTKTSLKGQCTKTTVKTQTENTEIHIN